MTRITFISRQIKASVILLGAATAMAVGGCAQQASPPIVYSAAQPGAGAVALSCDPAVSRDLAEPDVARDGREPQVTLGYEEQTTTYGDTFTWDDQETGPNGQDNYNRQSYLEQVRSFSR
jgi:hypothetical protein